MGHLLRVGLVERLAKLAAINLRIFADFRDDLSRIVIPPLEMPSTKLPFCIFFVAGPLFRFADFNLLLHGRSLGNGCRRRRRRGRCCRWLWGRCCR